MKKRATKANLPLPEKKAKAVDINDEDIILTVPYKPASRSRSWLDIDQVEREHWEVVDKICDMLFDTTGKWHPQSVSFARNVLEFHNDHEFISWKQYDSIMKMKTAKEYKAMYGSNAKIERLSYKPGVETLHNGGKTITAHQEGSQIRVSGGGVTFIDHDSPLGMAFKYAKTDRDFDRLAHKIFGFRRIPEDEGLVFKYDKAGNRYEAFPDADDTNDFIDLLMDF